MPWDETEVFRCWIVKHFVSNVTFNLGNLLHRAKRRVRHLFSCYGPITFALDGFKWPGWTVKLSDFGPSMNNHLRWHWNLSIRQVLFRGFVVILVGVVTRDNGSCDLIVMTLCRFLFWIVRWKCWTFSFWFRVTFWKLHGGRQWWIVN